MKYSALLLLLLPIGAVDGKSTARASSKNFSGSHVIPITSVTNTISFTTSASGEQPNSLDNADGHARMTYVKITS